VTRLDPGDGVGNASTERRKCRTDEPLNTTDRAINRNDFRDAEDPRVIIAVGRGGDGVIAVNTGNQRVT